LRPFEAVSVKNCLKHRIGDIVQTERLAKLLQTSPKSPMLNAEPLIGFRLILLCCSSDLRLSRKLETCHWKT